MNENYGDCMYCKYFEVDSEEFPCVNCRKTASSDEDGYNKIPLLWEEQDDPVNHPSHYCQEGSMECIDEMIAVFGKEAVMHFCLLNVWKYRKRAIYKNGEQDLKKSDWYMNTYVELKGKLV